uniref:Uncharacterized protein n=1 Tax=Ciona intestinalis TaxID=7719 RepID=H2XTS2_CIOIN
MELVCLGKIDINAEVNVTNYSRIKKYLVNREHEI